MSRVFKSFDTEIAENLTPSEPKPQSSEQSQAQRQQESQDQQADNQESQKSQSQTQPQAKGQEKRKSAIKKQTFDELYGEPENFLEIEVS